LRLYYFEGMTYSQIARLEGISHSTVITTIEQAPKRLRNLRPIFIPPINQLINNLLQGNK